MADPAAFDDVVVGCPSLLRTAYLLTGDAGAAERLLQAALVRASRRWGRLDGDAETYVRDLLAATFVSRWRRWRPENLAATGDPLWDSLGRLSRRERAVVVLRYHAGLSEPEVARVLGVGEHVVTGAMADAFARLGVGHIVDITADGR